MPTLFSASLSAGRDAGGRLVAWFHAIPRRRRRSLDLERSAGVWIESFTVTIHIFNEQHRLVPAAGILDTGCERGNWISERKVKEIGMESAVFSAPACLMLRDFNGRLVASDRIIELVWKRHPEGARTYKATFYVHPAADHVDVVFSREYIRSERLFTGIEPLMLTGTSIRHTKESKEEREEVKQLEEQQEKRKADLAAMRAAEEAAKRAAEEEAKRAAEEEAKGAAEEQQK